jgi:hypothetical protein
MPNFTDVQFISWEIYTGPNRGPLPWGPINITPLGMSPPGASYTGIDKGDNQRLFPWIKMDPPLTESDNRLDVAAQILDIDARVSFTYEAIDQAVPYVDTRQTTLKLFMAPEFLYRGKGGAYVHDLINGWKGEAPAELGVSGASDFPGLFGRLRRRLFANVQSEFLDWLFVFGTAISASFPAKNENEKWVRDATKPGEIYNTALIQSGRNFDAVYASRKHYKSGIDFIQQYLGAKAFTDGDVVPADRADLEPNETNREGSAIFTMKEVNDKDGQPIKFGLEVCLDHATSTGSDGKPRNCGRICTAN